MTQLIIKAFKSEYVNKNESLLLTKLWYMLWSRHIMKRHSFHVLLKEKRKNYVAVCKKHLFNSKSEIVGPILGLS